MSTIIKKRGPKTGPGTAKAKNPLAMYKFRNRLITWPEISKRTGIPIQTLMNLVSKSPQQMMNMKLETYYRLRKFLGIDMVTPLLTMKQTTPVKLSGAIASK